jgi:UDP-N-acetylmuramoyl-tripeptide--D-alanyl-D-alanine ligase
MEVTDRSDGVTVVNDAYNANPDSVRAALEALAVLGRGRRTWAVLGEMRELGAASDEEHREVGRLVARLGVSRLVAVGEGARQVRIGALEATGGAEMPSAGQDTDDGHEKEGPVVVPDAEAALALLHEQLRPGDVVLVKASRAAGLERVASGLLAAESRGLGG